MGGDLGGMGGGEKTGEGTAVGGDLGGMGGGEKTGEGTAVDGALGGLETGAGIDITGIGSVEPDEIRSAIPAFSSETSPLIFRNRVIISSPSSSNDLGFKIASPGWAIPSTWGRGI